jgi:hypothetical protein
MANTAPMQNGFTAVNQVSGDCPAQKQKKALEVVLGYFREGNFVQIGGTAAQIATGNSAMQQTCSAFSPVRFDGLDDQDYELSLPTLDGNVWDPIRADPLTFGEEISRGDAVWQLRQPIPTDGVWHNIVSGQGVDKIAYWAGRLPKTIWSHGNNAKLAGARQGWNVLARNDPIFIPPVQSKSINVRPCYRYFLVRHYMMARFRLRLCAGMQPLSGVPFLLEFQDVAPVEGLMGEGGIIDIEVPAFVEAVKVTFGNPSFTFVLKLESLLPIADDSGVQQRLRNLGFPFVSDTHPWAAGVIKRAQQSFGQTAMGIISEDLRKALFHVHDR